MCYAYKPVRTPSGRIQMHTVPEIRRLQREGKIKETSDGFFYVKDVVPVVLAGGEVRPMRWDLIPADYLRQESLPVSEMIRRKNSRAVNPATGKSWGFSSYNARIETVRSLWAFKESWRAGRRGLIAAEAFKERPNMDDAPPEVRGREFEVFVEQPHFLAALYDTWRTPDGRESLDSCTVVTASGEEVPELRAIWHERVPVLLDESAAEAWLDPATSPETAYEILRDASTPKLTVREVPKKPRNPEKPPELQF